MNKDRYDKIRNLLAVLAVCILAAIIGQAVSVISFNQREHSVKGADDSRSSYLAVNDREDSTSKWVKRDYDLNGTAVDINAQTFDATLFNNSGYDISDWKLTVKINGDCFINNAWCGTMEIHQHAGTKNEKVQTLDLRNYELSDVELDYLYDGDLLIPLSKGDYLVYEPSEKDDELPVRSGSELTMGMIFYYIDSIDLSDYRLDYYYHRDFDKGIGFVAIIALIAAWAAIFIAFVTASVSYRRAWKDMELRRSGISYMSAIYDLICIVDIPDDRLTPVYARESNEDILNKNESAQKQFAELFVNDADEHYSDTIQSFVDISTLDDRLDRESITCEFISRTRGWCRARFIAMDRDEDDSLKEVIFTIRGINDEKRDIEELEERLKQKTRYRKLSLVEHEFSFSDLISEIHDQSVKIAEKDGREFTMDTSRELPDIVTGNEVLLRHLISYMLKYASESTGTRPIKLSVYSKTLSDKAHILVSVAGQLDPARDDDAAHELINGLLGIMGSSLKIIDDKNGMREMYFEADLKIASDAAGQKTETPAQE